MNNPKLLLDGAQLFSSWELSPAEESDLEEFVQSKEYKLVRKCLSYRVSEIIEDLVTDLSPEKKGAMKELMSVIYFFDEYLPGRTEPTEE